MQKFSIEILEEILTNAGVEFRNHLNSRLYIKKTPCGGRSDYGYLVAGDDIRDVTDKITKRAGEISAILRAA